MRNTLETKQGKRLKNEEMEKYPPATARKNGQIHNYKGVYMHNSIRSQQKIIIDTKFSTINKLDINFTI